MQCHQNESESESEYESDFNCHCSTERVMRYEIVLKWFTLIFLSMTLKNSTLWYTILCIVIIIFKIIAFFLENI